TARITPRVSPRPAPRSPMDAYPAPAPEPGRYPVAEKPSETDTHVLPAMATPAKKPKLAAPVSPAPPEPTQVSNKSTPVRAEAESDSSDVVSASQEAMRQAILARSGVDPVTGKPSAEPEAEDDAATAGSDSVAFEAPDYDIPETNLLTPGAPSKERTEVNDRTIE